MVITLLNYISDVKFSEFDCDFYIDESKKCAYIEIYELQFSFHNIFITEKLQTFIDSELNKPKLWKGVQLQEIAGELLTIIIDKKRLFSLFLSIFLLNLTDVRMNCVNLVLS